MTLGIASVLSLIFQIGFVYALQPQDEFGFVQLPLPVPLPIPGGMSQRMQSQPNQVGNHTQEEVGNNNISTSISPMRKATEKATANQQQEILIPNQYIVMLKPDVGSRLSSSSASKNKLNNLALDEIIKSVSDRVQKIDASIIYTNKFALGGFLVKVADPKAVDIIKQDPNVAFVEQDKIVHINSQVMPTGIMRVGAERSSAASGSGLERDVDADIAILDTGISLNHQDLNVYRQQTFVANTTTADDDNGHGTHVAGIAAAKDNSIGVVGVAPGARLWAVKVLDKDGAGAISTIIKGIDYVTQHASEIDVVNLSFGCECNSPALDAAINNSVQAGITYVVAAGNEHKDASTSSPASNPNVITVSAIADSDGKCGGIGPPTKHGNDDTLADFSNFGKAVSIAAPGVNILSTYKDNSYATLSGTSMASPFVAGAAALYKASHQSASPSEVRSALISDGSTSSTACDGDGHGYFKGEPSNTHEPLLYVGGF
jgi:subtilisin family serine protease